MLLLKPLIKTPIGLCESCRGVTDLQLCYLHYNALLFKFLEESTVKRALTGRFWPRRALEHASPRDAYERPCAWPRGRPHTSPFGPPRRPASPPTAPRGSTPPERPWSPRRATCRPCHARHTGPRLPTLPSPPPCMLPLAGPPPSWSSQTPWRTPIKGHGHPSHVQAVSPPSPALPRSLLPSLSQVASPLPPPAVWSFQHLD
jgi:hypothetical protein